MKLPAAAAAFVLLTLLPVTAFAKGPTDPKRLAIQKADMPAGYVQTHAAYKMPPADQRRLLRRHGFVRTFERTFASHKSKGPMPSVDAGVASFRSGKGASWAEGYLVRKLVHSFGSQAKVHVVSTPHWGQKTVAFLARYRRYRLFVVGVRVHRYIGVLAGFGSGSVFKRSKLYPVAHAQAMRLRRGA